MQIIYFTHDRGTPPVEVHSTTTESNGGRPAKEELITLPNGKLYEVIEIETVYKEGNHHIKAKVVSTIKL